MVDERFAEIFFLAKDEYGIKAKSDEEKELYDMLDKFKEELRQFCKLNSLSEHWKWISNRLEWTLYDNLKI